MTKSTGGYIITPTPLLRTLPGTHTDALDRPVSPAHLAALNAVQETPWRVNSVVFEVAAAGWNQRLDLPGIAEMARQEVPPRLADDVWEAMTDEARREHRMKQASAWTANASAAGKEHAMLDCLSVAGLVQDRPAIWFPHSLDFRGRLYPVATSGLTPQGSDLAKGLLEFAEARPLGPDGEFWLLVRAANTFGKDKLSLVDRVEWALENRAALLACGIAPLDYFMWRTAEEPWQFLATCFELWRLDDWVDSGLDPETFQSRLPIPLDGSCSGIQHLSALGLDPIGARATNLVAGLPRQDVYEAVAARCRELNAEKTGPEAEWWAERITRSTVKRAVMTTPYGVTSRGIAHQIVQDGFVDGAELSQRGPLATHLRDLLEAALASTVVAAKQIMAWLQEVAAILAKAQVPFRWTTPCGSRVEQAYRVEAQKRIETLVGEVYLRTSTEKSPLDHRKAALAASPNVIHSFDAAHAVLTVNAAVAEGVSSFALIHDSFGTHAGETTRLSRVLREQFSAIYSANWLEAIYLEVHSYAPHLDIPRPPERGSWDVSEVLDAEFAFS